MVRILAGLICLAMASLAAGPAAARNLALVIGNNAYQSIPQLTKAVSDARLMRTVLDGLGFTVVEAENATYLETAALLANLVNQIERGDTVFFHFSGQGIALGADNLLLPVDVPKPESGQDVVVRRSGFNAAEIIASFQARGARVVIGVLDACRDNPFAAEGVPDIGAARGLAPIHPPRGSFVFYAAGAGEAALERLSDADRDAHSVFTRIFAKTIGRQGMSLVEVAKETQITVRDLAAAVGHDQVPAYSDEIVGNVILAPDAEGRTSIAAGDADTPSTASKTPTPNVNTAIASRAPADPVLDPPVRSVHGNWKLRCDTPAGAAAERCGLIQFVTATDRENVGLSVIILRTADKKANMMRILAPLGVLLSSGLGLKIDETDMGRTDFVRCLPNGCVAEVILDDDMLNMLSRGRTAIFFLYQTPDEPFAIPIALSGFQEGVASLP